MTPGVTQTGMNTRGADRSGEPPRDCADVMGLRIERLDLDATIRRVDELIQAGNPSQHVAINAAKVVAMRTDQKLAAIVHGCDLVSADGQAVVWASRLLADPLPERVAGIDMMYALLQRATVMGYRVYFFGARQAVVQQVVAICQTRYPQLKIGGWRCGYFTTEEESDIVADIQQSDSQILFVAMGTPKKEYWIAQHLSELGPTFCMGVGGSFDVLAGEARRAPHWMQRAGMEWLYRLLQEPRRLFGRYARTNAIFLLMLVREWLRRRRQLSDRVNGPSRQART